MKTIALMPMRGGSERVENKNLRNLAGTPLYHYMLRTLLELDFIHSVYVDTDSNEIAASVKSAFPNVRIHRRLPQLGTGDTSMNEVIAAFIEQNECDEILQVHSTSPFLSPETLTAAYVKYAANISCDSMFSVSRIHARLWTQELSPINHDPNVLLRTQDLSPVLVENSGFYILKTADFNRRRNRIGHFPMTYDLSALESIDIDTEADFKFADSVARGRQLE